MRMPREGGPRWQARSASGRAVLCRGESPRRVEPEHELRDAPLGLAGFDSREAADQVEHPPVVCDHVGSEATKRPCRCGLEYRVEEIRAEARSWGGDASLRRRGLTRVVASTS